jgi:hypothetical protein
LNNIAAMELNLIRAPLLAALDQLAAMKVIGAH